MNETILQDQIDEEICKSFQLTCIRELTEIDIGEEELGETIAETFVKCAAGHLDKKLQSFGCENFRDLIVPVENESIDATLAELMKPYEEDWEEYGIPKDSSEMVNQNLIGLLVYPGEIGFVGADLNIQMWSFWEDLYAHTPENHIVSFNPLITFDLYGNVNGYSLGGLVCIFEGYGGDWGDPEDWGWS